MTAVMFCRRYFAIKSVQRNDPSIIGAAALHLAGKAEDDPQRLDKVIHQIFTYRCSLVQNVWLCSLQLFSLVGVKKRAFFAALSIYFYHSG